MHVAALPAVLACLALSAHVGRQLDPADPVGPDTIELATETVRVPFELARSRPVPVVEASLNGRGPFRFFLDTGASGCVLDSRLMAELGLVSQGKTEVGDPSRNQPLQADVLRIEELVLGGLRARGLPAVAFDRSSLDRGDGVRGILGLSLFTRHLLTLDYGEKAVLVRAGALERDAPHVVPFELEGVPRVLIDVDGALLEATIDSGSPSGITLPHAFAQEHTFLEPLAVIARGRTVNSEFEVRGGRLDGDVSLAGHVFADPFVQTNELFDHVNLGYEVLRHFALTIDLAQKLASFERRGEGALEVARPAPAVPAPAGPARRDG